MPHAYPFYLTAERRHSERDELKKLLERVGEPTRKPGPGVPREAVEDELDEFELTGVE
jgi:hypothetical protein